MCVQHLSWYSLSVGLSFTICLLVVCWLFVYYMVVVFMLLLAISFLALSLVLFQSCYFGVSKYRWVMSIVFSENACNYQLLFGEIQQQQQYLPPRRGARTKNVIQQLETNTVACAIPLRRPATYCWWKVKQFNSHASTYSIWYWLTGYFGLHHFFKTGAVRRRAVTAILYLNEEAGFANAVTQTARIDVSVHEIRTHHNNWKYMTAEI